MTIHTDCRQYRISVPCDLHKQTLARCHQCADYAPIEQRILVVKLGAIGDVLRTTACLDPLKRLYPRSHITWITRTNATVVLTHNPAIDRILTVESNYLEVLLSEEFDLVLGPDADSLSASITGLARAHIKRGFVADRRGGVIPLNDAARHWWHMGLDDGLKRGNRRTYGEWLYQICELPLPVARPWLRPSAAARDRVSRFVRSTAPDASKVVCFNTGASQRWQEKRWKPDYYRDLAMALRQRLPGTAVILTGGPGEAEFNANLLKSDAGFIDGGTNNSVDAFAAIVACSDWILTPDSLGYHVACAVETPALCLVGPTSPWELDLYETNQVFHADVDCIGCYLPQCPFAVTCMGWLTPRIVWPQLNGRDGFDASRSGVVAVSI